MNQPTLVAQLLNSLQNPLFWAVFTEISRLDELGRSKLLRPHDDVGFDSVTDRDAMKQRERLDQALGTLTLVEIAIEVGLLQNDVLDPGGPLAAFLQPGLGDFRILASSSDAFYRYASAYLYFGARLFSFRCFKFTFTNEPPGKTPTPISSSAGSSDPDERFNRRLFSLKTPPPLVIVDPPPFGARPNMFKNFLLHHPNVSRWAEALQFLDGFHKKSDSSDIAGEGTLTRTSLQEPVHFELWLRGLLPEADPVQQQRFQRIRDGLVAWAESRTRFYLDLQRLHFRADGEDLIEPPTTAYREAILTNPLTARFALADIYWLAGLLRAEVSTNASVSDTRLSWLKLIAFKAGLDREPDTVVQRLKENERILRSVFGFVCDLVQNSIALTVRAELEHFNPQALHQSSKSDKSMETSTKEWRAVFDEEMREIDRQRSQRTYTDSAFAKGERFSFRATNPNEYWSERLLTGRQPHNRIGVAFSGGGIRSATFNLGVLQGLQEFDLLRHVDYLSTVSGGGFIGSWLVGNVHRTRQWLGRATRWDESIDHLRSYSSYLAPLNGILSADTWTLIATWIRNTFLIQITGIVWLFTLLLGVLEVRRIFLDTASSAFLLRIPWLLPAGTQLTYASLLAVAIGSIVTFIIIASFTRGGVETGKNQSWASARSWVALIGWVGSFVIAGIQWRISGSSFFSPDPSAHTFSTILKHAWHQEKLLLGADATALYLIGLWALRSAKSAATPAPATFHPTSTTTTATTPQAANQPSATQPSTTQPATPAAAPVTTAQPENIFALLWRSLWIGTLCVAVLYLALCAILCLNLWWRSDPTRYNSYAFVFDPALVLTAFAVSIVFFIGLSGRTTGEAQREWWTRFGAWLVIYAIAGLALSAAAVFGPRAVEKLFTLSGKLYGTIKWGAVATWLGTIIAGLFAGNSSKTAGAASSGKKLGLDLVAKAGGALFVAGAILGAAWILFTTLSKFATVTAPHPTYWQTLEAIHTTNILATLLVIVPLGFLFSWFFEINIFGLSQFYRNRLVRCYLGATRWAPGIRMPHPFTKFDFKDDFNLSDLRNDYRGPFPIFNCTLNLGGSSDLTIHSRHSASFSLTPLRCGSDRAKVGYASTFPETPNGPCFADGVKLGQAVAISGAAASPNMGYNTSPLVALLLTMFNVRLGWWFPNPSRKSWSERGLRFSLYYLTRELLGSADENSSFLNVSDGGHFENLGIYELIRRRCKVIIACDGECDEHLQFGSLGNLIRIAATDFAAVIELDVKPIRQQRDGHSLAHCSVGRIKYSNGSIGFLIYLKASITGDEDIGITQYRAAHPTFPHETTANQFFSEDQFESYRELGRHVVRRSFRSIQPGEHPLAVAERLEDVNVPPRITGESYLKHTRTLARIWDEFRRAPALHSFLDELLRIHPTVSVEPSVPSRAHRTSEEFAMALQLIQLMEDVYMDLQLEDYWEHPDNRGWAFLFMRWARSPRFRYCWNQAHRTYGIRFEYFCEARLGLLRDDPIIRM